MESMHASLNGCALWDSVRTVNNNMQQSSMCDSTHTTNRTGSTIDWTTQSDLTSDISSSVSNPESLASYQLQRQLGRGKYSQVFAATHAQTGTQVAMKKLCLQSCREGVTAKGVTVKAKVRETHPPVRRTHLWELDTLGAEPTASELQLCLQSCREGATNKGATAKGVTVKARVAIFDMMDPQARVDCLREVKILQSLEHPNIIKCFNSFIQDNELIIILEWAESGDLGLALRNRAQSGIPFPQEQVQDLFSQICSAMVHMHDRRMMHRDLKPHNIFIAADGKLKLGDLGLSRYFSSRTLQAMTTVGTPIYMSPECIKGLPYEFSSDIWSLGCLLYELITLRNPFYKEHQSLYVLGKNITSCTYEPLPEHVAPHFRQLVAAMLQPLPSSRPTIYQVWQMLKQPELQNR